MKSEFTGFILAGGKSSRMGIEKQTLEIGGKTFLARAADALEPVCQTVKIVLNRSQAMESELPVVRDIYEQRGALGGIHAALQNCDTKFAVILAVDLPRVTTGAIESLVRLALASNKFTAVVPRQTDGRPQPLCAVYRVKYCLPPLEKILGENDSASVRDFLDAISPKYIDASRLSTDEDLLFNVNYPEDFLSLN